MITRYNGSKTLIRLIVIAGILTLALGLTFIYTGLAAPGDDFEHKNNISRTSKLDLQSSPPEMTTNGTTMVVVWSDGFNDDEDTKEAGHIYLKAANVNDGYWRAKTPVFSATNNSWGINPAVTFDKTVPNRVHVVWSESTGCANTVPGGAIFDCKFQTIKYTSCNVSGDINTCQPSQTVATTGAANTSYVAPRIVGDADNDLHVVWLQSANTLESFLYSRHDGSVWSGAALVPAITSGQDVQLAFSTPNNRLHVVWDDEAANKIKHFYDASHDDNTLTAADLNTLSTFSVPYLNGDPGNPSIAARDGFLVIAFDTKKEGVNNNFGLFYSVSNNEGTDWIVQSIPEQLTVADYNSPDPDFGLKPSLAITKTGGTYRVHTAWHYDAKYISIFNAYQVFYSSLDLTGGLTGGEPDWTKPFTVTNPGAGVTALSVASPEGFDSIEPALIATEPSGGGGSAHVTFLEDEDVANSSARQLDVFYHGGINGTIDPEYIIDTFVGDNGDPLNFKVVTPDFVETTGSSVTQNLAYEITFENTGELDAIGFGITDTLPSPYTLISGPTTTGSSTNAVHSGGKITWFGDVNSGDKVVIAFTLRVTVTPPTTIKNKVQVWNKGTGGQPFMDDSADTIFAAEIIYLPLTNRNF